MEVGDQLHAPDSLVIVQETRWAPGRFRLVRKISPPPALDPWTVQPLTSRFTNDAIPAHKLGGSETQSKDCFPGWHRIVWYKFNGDAWEWAISVFRFSKLLPDWMMSNSRKQNLYLSRKNHKSQKKETTLSSHKLPRIIDNTMKTSCRDQPRELNPGFLSNVRCIWRCQINTGGNEYTGVLIGP